MEEWRKCTVCDLYEVSNMGNVRNTENGYILKGSIKWGYKQVTIHKKWYRVHRLVAHAFIPNPDNKPEVDHIDKNTSNNTVSNLRWATRSENLRNRGMFITNKTGFTGVCLYKSTGKYKSFITHNKKRIHLGQYDTAEEAYRVRLAKERELFGEYARS